MVRYVASEVFAGDRKVLSTLVMCLILLLPLALPLQMAMAEDLIQVFRLAKEHDPVFEREMYRHEASPEALTQAYSELLPNLSVDSTYRQTKQEILSSDVAVYQTDTARYPAYGYTLSLVQPVLKLSSVYRVKQAREEMKRADLKFEAAKQDLILRVAETYSGLLEAMDSLTFTRAEEAAVQRHYELAENRYRSGLAPVTDYHDAKARLADTMALKVKVKNRLEDAIEALTELTGRRIENVATLKAAPVGGTFPKAGQRSPEGPAQGTPQGSGMPLVSPEPNKMEDWLEAASQQNLDIRVQQQTVEVAEKEIERQKAGHAPVLSVVGRLNRDYEGGSLFGGESDVKTTEAFAQLTFPLFQGFSVTSRTREAVKLHSAAKADLEKEVRSVQRTTKASFLGVMSSIENAEAFKQSVLSNQMALEAKREGFKSGLFPALAVLDAERDLHRARQDYAKANYDYVVYSLRLKRAVGALAEEDLIAVNQWLE
jgi:outer membrane protein